MTPSAFHTHCVSDNVMNVKTFHVVKETNTRGDSKHIALKTLVALSFQIAFTVKSSHTPGH